MLLVYALVYAHIDVISKKTKIFLLIAIHSILWIQKF